MEKRITLLIVALVVLALLALGSTVGVMALTHGGSGMMNRQQGYQGTMGGNQPGNMMGGNQPGNMMGGNQPGNMMGGNQQTPATAGTPATGVNHLTIQNFAYQMRAIQVRVGTTVTWTNLDTVPHSVTFKNGMKDSGLFSQGQSFSYTFTTPGTYTYFCTIHPSMMGMVQVVS